MDKDNVIFLSSSVNQKSKPIVKTNIIRSFMIISRSYSGILSKLVLGTEGSVVSLLLSYILESNLIDLGSNCFSVKLSDLAKRLNKKHSRINFAICEILKSDLLRVSNKKGHIYTFMFNPEYLQCCNVDTFLLAARYKTLPKLSSLRPPKKKQEIQLMDYMLDVDL